MSFQRIGDDGVPAMIVDGDTTSPEVALWLTLHTYYTDLTLFEFQVSLRV